MTERRICESDGYLLDRCLTYDRGVDESPSVAVVTALARYHGESVTETSTNLYEYVDPEALDALFTDTRRGVERSADRVEFEVEDVTVVVTSTRVEVSPTAS
ncbi:hypothetical protein EA462_05335 [Natrarchaeobius halalkaliphilus]|uniref:Halobacterial output domain-containing protein n=1 Tax=Natrarchaeobius halalkaliphilus TaxID=1679091 RepID=A0A3N6MCE6_9EURY|nr:HalOD1 output domain-containing protein [Natrarchaeobius halalkaliphilus]RQG91396.1 hypothetical protein EA462_05335 [Natrarchaeobius halalkaliphilus]